MILNIKSKNPNVVIYYNSSNLHCPKFLAFLLHLTTFLLKKYLIINTAKINI